MSKKLILRLIAGGTAFLLIAGILYVLTSFVGNPITGWFADRAIKEYVKNEYGHLGEVKISDARYNFKDGSYAAFVESKDSPDTKFYVYYRGGEVEWDDYDFYVNQKQNTIQRFENEYSHLAQTIIQEELGLENDTRIFYEIDATNSVMDKIELDMPFDRTLPLKTNAMITIEMEDFTTNNIARFLTEAHHALKRNNCSIGSYSIYINNENFTTSVYGVTSEQIESNNLIQLLEEAKEMEEANGISFHQFTNQ